MANIEWFKDNWEKIEESADFPPGLNSAVRDAEEIVTSTPESAGSSAGT